MEIYLIIHLLQYHIALDGALLVNVRHTQYHQSPPANIRTGEPIFVQSYINAYNTAFNQSANPQRALYHYVRFSSSDVNVNFVPGTFGYNEEYNKIGERFFINSLTDSISNYIGNPYLFISAGSGGGSGFMYLDWIIVTYGVPYVVSVS